MSSIANMEQRLEREAQEFQALSKQQQTLVGTLNQLQSQLQENEMVKKEFELMAADAVVYKMIGPVLVKQERAEAVDNVKRRIEFLKGDVKRSENQLKEIDDKQSKKRNEIMKLQANFQRLAQEASSASSAAPVAV